MKSAVKCAILVVILSLVASGCAIRSIDYDRKRILVAVLGLGVVFVSDKEGSVEVDEQPDNTAMDGPSVEPNAEPRR